jgi:hypothetical protein
VLRKTVTKGAPQGSCSCPGYWNIQYNSLPNTPFMKHIKVGAFADDLILAIRSSTTRAAENISNIEMYKITTWAKNNKISFNEKSKFMIVSRRKRKENKEINIYINNKSLKQVTQMKYLGFIIDNKFKFS